MCEFLYNFVNYSWQNKRLWLTVGCCNTSPQLVILPGTNWKFWECNIKFDSRNYSWSDFIGTWNKRSYLPLLLLPSSFLEIISLYLTLNYINSMGKDLWTLFFLNYQKYGNATEIIHQSPKQNIFRVFLQFKYEGTIMSTAKSLSVRKETITSMFFHPSLVKYI